MENILNSKFNFYNKKKKTKNEHNKYKNNTIILRYGDSDICINDLKLHYKQFKMYCIPT